MKGVHQTILRGEPDGDCFRACVASLFEVEIARVPNFVMLGPDPEAKGYDEYPGQDPTWWGRAQRWCMEHVNVLPMCYPASHWTPPGYCIGGLKLPHGLRHACVFRDGLLVWNPWPGQEAGMIPTATLETWTVFFLLDPARPVVWPA